MGALGAAAALWAVRTPVVARTAPPSRAPSLIRVLVTAMVVFVSFVCGSVDRPSADRWTVEDGGSTIPALRAGRATHRGNRDSGIGNRL
ncbi:hypothetical protein GCM10009548_79010 [Streptomyces malaysiensis subsp. malaysiensis]